MYSVPAMVCPLLTSAIMLQSYPKPSTTVVYRATHLLCDVRGTDIAPNYQVKERRDGGKGQVALLPYAVSSTDTCYS
eukprot:3857773-Rhodomonas_salina.1